MAKKKRNTFSGSLGFILAAAGSAIGLGNIWRFPYLAARDGGGLFLLIYILLAVSFGFTLLITEVAMGRRSQQGPLTAYGFFHRGWRRLGLLAFAIPFLIYPYYCVIGGWVMKYLSAYFTLRGHATVSEGYFTSFITSLWSPLFFTGAFCLAAYYIVYNGVERGIEKVSRIMMPMLVVMMVGISVYSLFITQTDVNGVERTGLQGAALYFIPSFEGLTLERLLNIMLDAMGQLFYSLSVAMGIMITYGSYLKKGVNLGKAVDHIEICDTFIAVLAGMMIVPAVYVFMGTEGMSAGPSLMFVALPKVFDSLGWVGMLIGALFFLLVLFAALTSAVSLLEACTSSFIDKFHWSRRKAVTCVALVCALVSAVVSLGYNVLYFEYTLPNGSVGQLLDILDYVTNNLMMPVLAILTCILMGWIAKTQLLVGEMRLNGYRFNRKYLYLVMLRFVAPALLFVLLLNAV